MYSGRAPLTRNSTTQGWRRLRIIRASCNRHMWCGQEGRMAQRARRPGSAAAWRRHMHGRRPTPLLAAKAAFSHLDEDVQVVLEALEPNHLGCALRVAAKLHQKKHCQKRPAGSAGRAWHAGMLRNWRLISGCVACTQALRAGTAHAGHAALTEPSVTGRPCASRWYSISLSGTCL